jgi:hypothetical protein
MIGASCGLCLELIPASDCPSEDRIRALPQCHLTHAIGDLCEADGECGTSRVANNCAPNHDVYRRCETTLSAPPWLPPSDPVQPPMPGPPPSTPLPPVAPLPPCGSLQTACSAGGICGSCLEPVQSECPQDESLIAALPNCHAVSPGALCEADGECGTSRVLNNCGINHDVYRRERCSPAALSQGPLDSLAWAVCGVIVGLALVGLVLCLVHRRRRRAASRAASRVSNAKTTVTAARGGSPSRTLELSGNDKGEVLVVHNEL